MRYVGIDLHKRSLTVCVIDRVTGETFGRRLLCQDQAEILEYFRKLGKFQAVVEASATYEWLWELLEPIAERLVLAHPKKVRVIAESMAKTDKRDAAFLAWLLSQDSVPEAHRPSPRQRAYQHLVRHRVFLVRQCAKIKVKIKHLFAARNVDCKGIFTQVKAATLAKVLPEAERFRVEELEAILEALVVRLDKAEKALKAFRKAAPPAEKENHAIITSVPGAGFVTADVVLSTLGDVRRFSSVKKVTSYSGLVPGIRISDNHRKRKELHITKEGSRLLRSMLVQAAWRAIRESSYWLRDFERVAQRRGRKKAIVAVARRLLGVIYTLLKQQRGYVDQTARGAFTEAPSEPNRSVPRPRSKMRPPSTAKN